MDVLLTHLHTTFAGRLQFFSISNIHIYLYITPMNIIFLWQQNSLLGSFPRTPLQGYILQKYATRRRYVTERIPILSTTHKPQPFFVSPLNAIVFSSEIEIYKFNGPLREKKSVRIRERRYASDSGKTEGHWWTGGLVHSAVFRCVGDGEGDAICW